jgi:hypothetical protein
MLLVNIYNNIINFKITKNEFIGRMGIHLNILYVEEDVILYSN